MGLMKNRRFWTTGRLEQNRYPSDLWPEGLRFTSQCAQCLLTYHEHLNPRDSCPNCGARMIVTESIFKEIVP